jgi:Lrp/AsnC family leucine-responsive transcriptional regulator
MTTTAPPLDHTSRRILQLLAADGRASYQAIADEIGLSRPAVMERVKRLEEAGFIQGYHARLDRPRCGFPVTAFVAIRYPVTEHAGDDPQIQALAANPHVLECHHVAGDDCYVLKVAAPSLESLEGVLREIKKPGQPVSTRTTIVLSTVFEKAGIVPVEAD